MINYQTFFCTKDLPNGDLCLFGLFGEGNDIVEDGFSVLEGIPGETT